MSRIGFHTRGDGNWINLFVTVEGASKPPIDIGRLSRRIFDASPGSWERFRNLFSQMSVDFTEAITGEWPTRSELREGSGVAQLPEAPPVVSVLPIEPRELTLEERFTWGTCPVCGARHGERCLPEVGIRLGHTVGGGLPDGGHLGRLAKAPDRVKVVPA